ncbi:hypothetical protein CCH79_00012516 [Gambusia affinis]|uniref:Ubinuclein middle domain-containing protein n=1 Tax=Gambusia affinis TaxID=33528 RepID=A0A315WA50_GAMAF|nr:hypothetical protein CCH79_00012516 [Gambusia affinis]
MAEPRKVQFVTLSAFAAGTAAESRKRRLDEEADFNFDRAGEAEAGGGAGGSTSNGRLGKTGDRDKAAAERRATVRLNLSLSEPDDRTSAEFNYGELIQNLQVGSSAFTLGGTWETTVGNKSNPPSLTASLNRFNDDEEERERLEVEALAKKFENKYGNMATKKRKDRMQDLIDIGFGYDETDPFIDNSEAYDELVPASLTTKLGGFYINTGTLQFRAASDSEGEEDKKLNNDKEQAMKKRKKNEVNCVEEKNLTMNKASRQFDQEGRKKFFTLDMNNILLDIELQVQEQPPEIRSDIYSHMEAFVPCNKEALLKRLKKLSLNIQDDRLRAPLLKLKLAVCSVMPEQIAKYNMECMAKVAKQQSGEADRNGSEEEDDEKPGKRVMGPRKKFIWDDKLRTLLCNLIRVKLSCYEMENQCTLSVEDYLKAFLENEVKPLWPKGWMQTRILFKESLAVHGHLTGNLVRRRVVPGPKAKAKDGLWINKLPLTMTSNPALLALRYTAPYGFGMLNTTLRVTALNLHRPEKKKRKKLMKDSLYLAAMLRRFTREKEEIKKQNPSIDHLRLAAGTASKPQNPGNATQLPLASNSTHLQGGASTGNLSLSDLTSDPAVMSLLGSANGKELQDLLGDLDFSLLDTDQQHAVATARENGILGIGVHSQKAVGGSGQGRSLGSSGGLFSPPPLPDGLPAPLIKRIEDLRAVSQLRSSVKPAPTASCSFVQKPQPPPPSSSANSKGDKTPPSSTASVLANQRQRVSVGGAIQSSKAGNGWAPSGTLATSATTSHLSQVSAAGSPLLTNHSALPLGFGMLGGLVPVSLPFQFPPLLNFSAPGAASAASMGSTPSSNSGYPLAQSDLMDSNQSQSGDMKRKTH